MKNLKFTSTIIILTMIFLVFSPTSDIKAEEVKLVITHINDIHSMIQPFAEEEGGELLGGIARISTVLNEIRYENENVLFLNAGDLVAGSGNKYQVDYDLPLYGYRGLLEIELMNQLGLDAIVPGNHEYDFGLRWMERSYEEADFEVLSANTFYRFLPDIEGKKGEAIYKPYNIFEFNGIKVAVVGISTDQYVKSAQILVEDPIENLAELISSVREKADLVVVLSHLGKKNDRNMAQEVDGIDIIVGGHSHTEILDPIREEKTLIVQADVYGKKLGKLELVIEDGEIKKNDYNLIPIDESIIPDQGIEQLIQEREVIGEIAYNSLVSSREEQSTLGNFITEAMSWYSGADIALIDSGIAEGKLEKGVVTAVDFFEVFWPYRARTVGAEKDLNEIQLIGMVKKQREIKPLPLWAVIGKSDMLESIVLIELTGEELLKVLNRSDEQIGTANYLQISGINLASDDSNYNLKLDQKYKVAVNLSLALGKGGYEQLWQPENFKILDKEVFEVILKYIKES